MERRHFTGALLAFPALFPAKLEASDNELAASEHFFQPQAAGDARWTGFRLSILLRREAPGQPCRLREIPSDEILRTGDRLQLRVQPNASGYLYVLTQDQDGSLHLLYPNKSDDKGANAAGAFQIVSVPSVDWLRFDDEPGVDPVLIIFSRQPISALESMRKKADATISERAMHRLIAAQAGDEQQREVQESRHGSIPAIFSVAQFTNDTDLIMERIEFTHRPARKKA